MPKLIDRLHKAGEASKDVGVYILTKDAIQRIKLLEEALALTLEWIDAVPDDTPLPAMPGFDRDWVDAVVEAEKYIS
jgi:hypothetical protein